MVAGGGAAIARPPWFQLTRGSYARPPGLTRENFGDFGGARRRFLTRAEPALGMTGIRPPAVVERPIKPVQTGSDGWRRRRTAIAVIAPTTPTAATARPTNNQTLRPSSAVSTWTVGGNGSGTCAEAGRY